MGFFFSFHLCCDSEEGKRLVMATKMARNFCMRVKIIQNETAQIHFGRQDRVNNLDTEHITFRFHLANDPEEAKRREEKWMNMIEKEVDGTTLKMT